jgi:DNA-damage-inducible protein D
MDKLEYKKSLPIIRGRFFYSEKIIIYMENTLITQLFVSFESIKHIREDGSEYWSARDLQWLLGYKEWRNFELIIEKAMTACREAWNNKFDHFVGINKMIPTGKTAEREIFDIHLTRYAAYLIAQNGDPRKQEISFAQAYFAVQTRKQELVEKKLLDHERILVREKLTQTEKQLTWLAFERWVDGMGIARIRSKGDTVLFGGNNTKAMKEKLWVHEDRSLADFLPTILLKAKDLAAEVTNHNIRQNKNMKWESTISYEHSKNNQWVRDFLVKSGITPEELPAETDIQKLKRQQETELKKLGDTKKK